MPCNTGRRFHTTLAAFFVSLIFTTSFSPLIGASESGQENDDKEIVEVKLDDGEFAKGQLYLPTTNTDKPIKKLVVFVHGSGPGTYLNKRKSGKEVFNYFDYWGERFNELGVAFFSYNKRGVTMSDEPPYYDQVDREKFRKVVPHIEVNDIKTIVGRLKQHRRLADAKVTLLGGSEGTIVAAMVAEKHPDSVDALIFFGYAHDNLYDVIAWQHSGSSSMLNLNPVFDTNGDKKIDKEEFESDETGPTRMRKQMKNVRFDFLDADKDGSLTAKDFAVRTKLHHNMLMYHFGKGNEDWIWQNYFRISIPWLKEHFELEPNRSRLTRLELPIFILHGELDPNVDVEGARDLQKRFDVLGKNNLSVHTFADHEHNLNFSHWIQTGEMSKGVAKIFEIVDDLKFEN